MSLERALVAADAAGITVDIGRVISESQPPSVSALQRPRLAELMQQVQTGDTVYTLNLSCLGSDARDMLATIARFRKAGVSLYCLQAGRADLTRRAPPPAVSILRALVTLEGRVRSIRAQQSAATAREMGMQLGRKPKLSEDQRRSVADSLACGESVSDVARRFQVSRQTVLRVRGTVQAAIGMAELPAS